MLACGAGARKGKREGESGAHSTRVESEGAGNGKRLQLTHCLFRLSRLLANEKSRARDFRSPFPFLAPATQIRKMSVNLLILGFFFNWLFCFIIVALRPW